MNILKHVPMPTEIIPKTKYESNLNFKLSTIISEVGWKDLIQSLKKPTKEKEEVKTEAEAPKTEAPKTK